MAKPSAQASAALLTALHGRDVAQANKLLRDSNPDPNVSDESGRTALHLVAALDVDRSQADVCALVDGLCARGAVVNRPNAHGVTPLQKAVLGRNTMTAITLIKHGADIHQPGPKGSNALDLARTHEFVAAMIRAAAARAESAGGCSLTTAADVPAVNAPDAAPNTPFGGTTAAAATLREEQLRRLWREQRQTGQAPPAPSDAPSTFAQYLARAARVESTADLGGADHHGNSPDGGDGGSNGRGGSESAASLVRREQKRRAELGSARLAQRQAPQLAQAAQRSGGRESVRLEGSSAPGGGAAERLPLPRWMHADASHRSAHEQPPASSSGVARSSVAGASSSNRRSLSGEAEEGALWAAPADDIADLLLSVYLLTDATQPMRGMRGMHGMHAPPPPPPIPMRARPLAGKRVRSLTGGAFRSLAGQRADLHFCRASQRGGQHEPCGARGR